jgi:hypothetical protein
MQMTSSPWAKRARNDRRRRQLEVGVGARARDILAPQQAMHVFHDQPDLLRLEAREDEVRLEKLVVEPPPRPTQLPTRRADRECGMAN